MKKRLISIALALIMVLSLFTITASASLTGAVLSPDKEVYATGETITVTYSGARPNDHGWAWIAVAPQGGAVNTYLDWKYVDAASGTLQLTAPAANGAFEIRIYQEYSASGLDSSASVNITVRDKYSVPTIFLDKDNYAAGETITVTYWDVFTFYDSDTRYTWIATAPQGGAPNSYLNYSEYLETNSGVIQLTAPAEDGAYEVRLYQGRSATTLFRDPSVNFTVGGTTTPPTTTTPPANADGPSSWAVPEVDRAKGLGLVPPELQSKYADAITRAEFCLLAVTLYENVTGTVITGRVKFTDTTDVNVEKAAYIKVVNGVGNDRFDPNGSLTREQAATMLARLAESVSKPMDISPATFADRASVEAWAIEAVGQCEAADIMGGTGNNQFSPKGAYQRQQSIATIMRMFDYLEGKGTPKP